MSEYLPVNLCEDDNFFVRSLGYEDDSKLAHWGGGVRNYCILHYVISGEGYFNGNKVCENQGFFIENKMYHEYHSSKENPWNYFWVIFSENLAKKYVRKLIEINENGIFDYNFRLELVELSNKIFCGECVLDNEKALSYFFNIMSMHGRKSNYINNRSLIHIANAKLYIERNISRKLSVNNVAKAINIDERYMYNLFKMYENISPKEYIVNKKIELATYLLRNTDSSITEVAIMTGFNDVCEFSKFFSLRTGHSPSKCRSERNGLSY